ncbi:hypothetical protein JTE90_012795 [Oedothorax gibbosus]|uniref:Kinesin-like protein n=1 Tax=Oedothorax gibbosus TaxID=931172 RepID=A0AAV6VYL1_9ARAC|nr:hypothetical protein JTE90_012795 [Oedothorax gibbosus]
MRPVRPKTPKKTPMSKFKSSVKDPIVVYCRIRPLENPDDTSCMRKKDEKTVVLFQPEISQSSGDMKEVHYSFQYVFNESTSQKELFDRVACPLVQDLLNGSNGLLFTYGITSSGKTYTMTGTPYDGGLVPRSLDVIFNSIRDYQAPKFVFKPDTFNGFKIQPFSEAMREQHKEIKESSQTPKLRRNFGDWSNRVSDTTIVDDVSPDMNYSVFVTYVEIYNNYIYDLLEEDTIDRRQRTFNSKILRPDRANNMYVLGATECEVKSVEEALEVFYKGQKKRKVGNTALNSESSRSHSVFTIRVVQAPLDNRGAEIIQDTDQVIVSQLSLVDLAGSERTSRTKNTHQTLGEAGNINNSLMALKMCIEALREGNQKFQTRPKYRDSKLTHLFKTFFEGEGKIRMIVCVNPSVDNYDEMSHVMRFAEMTQDVMIPRPTISTPNVLGLRSGRGKTYREALRKAKEQGVSLVEILPTVYSLGPEFPPLSLDDFDDEAAYMNLIDFLNARIIRRNTFTQDLVRKQDEFRKHLVAIDKENIQVKMENTRIQESLQFREQQLRGLEQKLTRAEQTVEVLQGQLLEFQSQTKRSEREIRNKDTRIAEQSVEIESIRKRMQDKLASEKDRLRRLVERRLAAKQAELEQKMCFNQEKFRQLNKILNADDWDMLGDGGPPSPPTSTATSETCSTPEPRRSKRKSAGDPGETEVKFLKAKSSTDVYGRRNTPQSSQPASSRNDFDYLFAKENKAPSSSQRSLAIANLRHRRSQSSSGDVWVEHKPIGNLDLNTVLQPKMKKKKSVTQLNVKDVTNRDSSKYLLQHQEQDSQGEVVTEMYKADIIPSAGGGAQVVFNDVETLQQTSPTGGYNLRKRSNECVPLREIEERCATSIACHGLPLKQVKKK